MFLPESPSWLLKHGQQDRARIVVENLVHPSESPNVRATTVKLTLQEMREDMKAHASMASWSEMLFTPDNRPALLVGVGFAAFQQLIGLDSLIFYSVYSLTHYGVSETTALQVTLVMGLLKLLFTIITTQLVDVSGIGRRWPLLVGAGGCVLGMFIMAIATSFPVSHLTSGVFVCGILLFVSAFGLGYGPMCWLILAEMFQGPFRSKGLSLGSLANRGSSFLVVSTYLSMVHAISLSNTFLVYMAVCVIAMAFSYWFIPELQGKKIGSDARLKLRKACCM
eukprot:jgi/Bigna1/80152/fgenesh1_pg.68_\